MYNELIFRIFLTGMGATLIMDVWTLFQKHVLSLPALNYALVGRGFLWMWRGKFIHNTIAETPPVCGEKTVGWVIHYFTGIFFAFIPAGLSGANWFWQPSIMVGLLTGILSLVAPLLIMQPSFGFGIAAAKTPHPQRARFLSFLTHLVYGFGLYITVKVIVAWSSM